MYIKVVIVNVDFNGKIYFIY